MLSMRQPALPAAAAPPIAAAAPAPVNPNAAYPAGPYPQPGMMVRPDPAEFNAMRRFALVLGLLYILVKVSYISETISYMTGLRAFLLPMTLIPALLLVLASGGLMRVFREKASFLMMFFVFWMVACIPASHWPGGSFERVNSYIRYDLVTLFIPAGIIVVWKDMRRLAYVLAAASFGVLFAVRFCSKIGQDGRLALAFSGTIGNANDLAAVLLLLTPFLGYCIVDGKVNAFARLLCFLAAAYSLYTVVGTASRGAVVAMGVGALFLFWKASMSQRLAALVMVPVLLAPAMLLAPKSALVRLSSLFGDSGNLDAEESGASRSYLFKQSVAFTLQKPVFGVGPAQFSNYEGHVSREAGMRGNWHETHCSWTQISSETGIPGFLFYSGAIFTALLLALGVNRRARQLRDAEVTNVSFCFLLAFVMYFTAITFLSNGYSTLQPLIVSTCVAMHFAARRAFAANPLASRPSNYPVAHPMMAAMPARR
jgi:O-antigen ligase